MGWTAAWGHRRAFWERLEVVLRVLFAVALELVGPTFGPTVRCRNVGRCDGMAEGRCSGMVELQVYSISEAFVGLL
jgi:hypothetical protein